MLLLQSRPRNICDDSKSVLLKLLAEEIVKFTNDGSEGCKLQYVYLCPICFQKIF